MKDFAAGALVGGIIGGLIGGFFVAAATQKSSQQSSQHFTVLRGPRLELRGPKIIHKSSRGHSDSIFESRKDTICEPKQDDVIEA